MTSVLHQLFGARALEAEFERIRLLRVSEQLVLTEVVVEEGGRAELVSNVKLDAAMDLLGEVLFDAVVHDGVDWTDFHL